MSVSEEDERVNGRDGQQREMGGRLPVTCPWSLELGGLGEGEGLNPVGEPEGRGVVVAMD